ncbi:MAG: hypothetical protein E6H65_06480 [Betaproteobacteria bacterium]|nr:MAG: hypothetical protein E6H65_06480 [Betaproteobacteria bacterium]
MRFILLASCVAPRRVPARRPGNFLLVAQKKVTKEKSLEHQRIWPARCGYKELTTFERHDDSGCGEPKFRRNAASFSWLRPASKAKGLASKEYEAARRRGLG